MRSGGANVGNVGLPAATVHFGVERDLLTFGQARHANSLEGGGVNKDVRSSVIRLDKTVAPMFWTSRSPVLLKQSRASLRRGKGSCLKRS